MNNPVIGKIDHTYQSSLCNMLLAQGSTLNKLLGYRLILSKWNKFFLLKHRRSKLQFKQTALDNANLLYSP